MQVLAPGYQGPLIRHCWRHSCTLARKPCGLPEVLKTVKSSGAPHLDAGHGQIPGFVQGTKMPSFPPPPHFLPAADRWLKAGGRVGRGSVLAQLCESSGAGLAGCSARVAKDWPSASAQCCPQNYARSASTLVSISLLVHYVSDWTIRRRSG